MKTYTKKHTNEKAARAHIQKIKARGGKHTLFEENGSWLIAYDFPEKATKKKASKTGSQPKATNSAKSPKTQKEKVFYDVMSPDGFTIRMPSDALFKSRSEGVTYFKKWKKRYESQGYYSSNKGRIALADLAEECSWEEVPMSKADSWLGFKIR